MQQISLHCLVLFKLHLFELKSIFSTKQVIELRFHVKITKMNQVDMPVDYYVIWSAML